ncbi:MotA/TolQ/ExbB proton channel family protein [Massilia sp. 9096]|uniref:MotA/TolQ/ExbB proton channel family protein n=1 Tax=Massilia sp. 9096 TaxID=1500894 RepID=UPI0018CF8D69|nr:MotA/TolQ/ExbB proton channel family protein [Massilia sp. 9096]
MPRSLRLPTLCCLLLPALPAAAQEFDLASQLSNGGIGILVIGALSVLMLAVCLERLANLRGQKLAPQALAEEAQALWREGRYDALRERVADGASPLARIVGFLLEHRFFQPETLATRAAELAATELREQQQKAYALNVVATIAPIVGLLGTVVGMIESFHVIAFNGMGDPTLLAGGISKALVNTAAGLSVALPSLALHHFFRNRLVNIGIRLERQLNGLLDLVRAPAPAYAREALPAAQEAEHAH